MDQLRTALKLAAVVAAAAWTPAPADETVSGRPTVEISAETLRDKVRGGLLGQLLGNLNGLEHEFEYFEEPGSVSGYVPTLPEGARTDDDTDFEWVYIHEMQRQGRVLLPPEEIAALWRERINRRIWCSNQYARQLMDIGLEPPLTGSVLLNPWAEFNISGQFLCETFGLIAPGMPRTASRIGLHYTRVAIGGEPAQTTQLFDTMIALAFLEDDIDALLDGGVEALDPRSEIRGIVADVRRWHRAHPADWRATRRLIQEKYVRVSDREMRDMNGYELNTAATITALVYGDGDLAKTLQIAFNMGWDCDNSAATAGTIVGVTKGYRWMLAQGWTIVDRYRNTTREGMPEDETITSFADRLIELAERVIADGGGGRVVGEGGVVYRLPVEEPGCVSRLPDRDELARSLRAELEPGLLAKLEHEDARVRAGAAYVGICLGLAGEIASEAPAAWRVALADLRRHEQVAQVLFHHSSVPAAEALREKMREVGIEAPAEKRKLW